MTTAIVLIFLVMLSLAAALGWTADTRDSADWKPSGGESKSWPR